MSLASPFFTICMPVYKSEPYIGGGIKDLLNQTFKDFECLVIDDGSPDDAVSVAKRLAGGDKRFKFIANRKNLGVSATRNNGIKKSNGQYILFLDSDDRYDVKLLQRVYEQISEASKGDIQVDVVTWEFGLLGETDDKIKQLEDWREAQLQRSHKPVGIYTPVGVADRIFQINTGHMCVKAFRRKFIEQENILFKPFLKFGEDALFSYTALCFAKNILAIPTDNILYYYRRNQPSSAMNTIDLDRKVQDQMVVISNLQKALSLHNKLDEFLDSFSQWAGSSLGALLYRITDSYQADRRHIDDNIFFILNSRSWRYGSVARELKRKFFKYFQRS